MNRLNCLRLADFAGNFCSISPLAIFGGFFNCCLFLPIFFTFSLILNAFNIRQEKNPCIAAVLKIRTRNFFLYLDQELFVSNPDLERSCIRKLFRTMYGEILNQPTISANLYAFVLSVPHVNVSTKENNECLGCVRGM